MDLRYSLRSLWKGRETTAIAIAAMALGIGANTMLFSVVNAVLLKPLRFSDPDRLISVFLSAPGAGYPQMVLSVPEYLDYREANRVFEHVTAYRGMSFNITGDERPERIPGARVSANFFALLGVNPRLGRAFTEEEDRAGNDRVVVLDHELWRRRFASDPGVIGQQLRINGESFAVIGVMPPEFRYPPFQRGAQIFKPMAFTPQEANRSDPLARGSHNVAVLARLRREVTLEQAKTEMSALTQRMVEQYPAVYSKEIGFGSVLVRYHENLVRNVRRALLVLLGAVGCLLLIACANVANLLLARAVSRRKEIAIRMALGAGRRRLIRQLLTESLVLASASGALGIMLAVWGLDLLRRFLPAGLPRLNEISVDGPVLAFTVLISALTGVIFGLTPALEASRTELVEALKESARGATGSLRGLRTRRALVVAEIAIALVLVIGAGLMMRSFLLIQNVDLGFRPDQVLTANVSLPQAKYREPYQLTEFYRQVTERIQSLPGVRYAGAVDVLPLGGDVSTGAVTLEGRPEDAQLDADVDERAVTPQYFLALGIPLVAGRYFTGADAQGAPEVAIVDEAMAKRAWPNESPLGKRFRMGTSTLGRELPWMSIVGVVRTVKQDGPAVPSRMQIYMPHAQVPAVFANAIARSMTLVTRSAGADPASLVPAVRREILSLDKDLPVFGEGAMVEVVASSIAQPRFNLLLFEIFAVIALLMAMIGTYGVMAYAVSERSYEIGIRMALGAAAPDVVRMVLLQGLRLVLAGVAIGLVAALALTRLMRGLLFGVTPTDQLTYVAVAFLLTAVALGASYLPARRATRVDPMQALRGAPGSA